MLALCCLRVLVAEIVKHASDAAGDCSVALGQLAGAPCRSRWFYLALIDCVCTI